MRKLLGAVAGAALLSAAVPVLAHHSFAAEFDAGKPVKLEGVVTKMDWINPHSWIHIDVTAPGGEVQKWMVEGGAPNALLRRGWTKNSLPAGTKILVQGFQAKDGSYRANGRDITFADGSKLFVGSSGTGAPDERPE
jgi:hypothetical protein